MHTGTWPSERSPLVTAAVSPWLSGSSFIYPISCIRVTGRLDCSILFQRVSHAWVYIGLNWETLKASGVWVTSPWILFDWSWVLVLVKVPQVILMCSPRATEFQAVKFMALLDPWALGL